MDDRQKKAILLVMPKSDNTIIVISTKPQIKK